MAAADTNAAAILSAGASHVGKVRRVNEDRWLALPEQGLWAIADGLGGHAHGERAARIAIDALSEARPGPELEEAVEAVAAAIAGAHAAMQAEPDWPATQMGSTIVALLLRGERCAILWVGDSRAYGFSDSALHRLTRDHSSVQEMLDRGAITEAEAAGHPMGHLLTRALGGEGEIEIDWIEGMLAPGDILLLSTDGLHDHVPEAEIARILGSGDPQAVVAALIEAALMRGAPDNVTAVVVATPGG